MREIMDENERRKWERRQSDERVRVMLDSMPLCCNFWDENYQNIDCNQEAVSLFDLSNKEEYLEKFHMLSPEFQPNGMRSQDEAIVMIKKAFNEGRVVFEWMHQKLNGEAIPAEITLVRVPFGNSQIVLGYTRDLREFKAMLEEMRAADERVRIMLDATPLCCNLWDQNFRNIECNQEAVELFELTDKKEYLEKFDQLSPEYQPDGMLSSEKALQMIQLAFSQGRVRFEWMHQKLNGDPVPSEITLVRVSRNDGDIVAGYTRDLRELKNTMDTLVQVESIAYVDSMTGVYNHRYFMDFAAKAFAKYEYNPKPLSIIMFDLDKFKDVNDVYGHLAGNEMLREVCERTQNVLRTGDILARYGGEEFIILAVNTNRNAAIRLAERIRESIAASPCMYKDQGIAITISLGVTVKNDKDSSLENTIKAADEALYMAKANGRNRVEYSQVS